MSTSYVSPQIQGLLGITPDEYVADPDLWFKHLHPDDRERALATYLQGRESAELFTFEYRLIARDGRVVWFSDSAIVIRDAEEVSHCSCTGSCSTSPIARRRRTSSPISPITTS